VITACTATHGGGIHCGTGSSPTIRNCAIVGNATTEDAGGIYCYHGSTPTIVNCTIGGNSAPVASGLVCDSYEQENPNTVEIVNCILWNGGDEIGNYDNSSITITHSVVEGGWTGEGNIGDDPLFVDPEDGDCHLRPCSPCIDAANNEAVPADVSDLDGDGDTDEPLPYDLDGHPRFVDDPHMSDTGYGTPPIVDMGAYEFQADCPGDLDGDRDVDQADLGILLAAWGTTADGDLDCDGDTDQSDLGILLANWGETCP
jgi:hypothetical protein